MKTYQPKKKEIKRNWHLIDAQGKILGRMASDITKFLIGKHKPSYVPHLDMGDYVVVINASSIVLSGKKTEQKLYRRHSGYPGGLKETKFEKLIETQPEKVIIHAVDGMLPGNRLKKPRLKRLRVYPGESYPYKDKFTRKSK